MSADASAFSCLPLAVRDSLLQQAFQQLDQRHLFGVAPRVCRLWHQLSLSIITSLDASIMTEAAARQLSLWMENHGAAGLTNLMLRLDQAVCRTPAARSLLQSLQAAMQLRSFDISSSSSVAVLDMPLSALNKLTSLSIKSPTPTMISSILTLSSLNSLSLSYVRVNLHGAKSRHYWESIMEQVATRLLGITSLDLAVSVSVESLAHLCTLPQLKRLSLGSAGFLPVAASSLRHLSALAITSIGIRSTTEGLSDASTWLDSAACGLEHLALYNVDGGPTAPSSFLPLHKAIHLKSLEFLRVKPDLTQLAALTQLTRLFLRGCNMHDADVRMLSALTGLQSLDLSCNPGITGAQGSMEVLARSMPQLRSLDLLRTAAQKAAQRAFQGHRLRLEA